MTEPQPRTMQMNPGYACRPHGAMKLVQSVMNIICVSMIGAYFRARPKSGDNCILPNVQFFDKAHLFFFLMSVTFLIGTLLILISCFLSSELAKFMANSTYELFYHVTGALLFFCCSVSLIVVGVKQKDKILCLSNGAEVVISAGVMGLFNSLLYSASAFLAFAITAH